MTVVATVPMTRSAGSAPEDRAEEALARRAEQDGSAERGEPVEAVEQREVVRHGLAEPDARVDHDLLLAHAAREREG